MTLRAVLTVSIIARCLAWRTEPAMSIKGSPKANDVRVLRLGMVGGGNGAFIGAVHRAAARLDGRYQLVAGALSSDAANAHASASLLGIDAKRSYADYADMATQEAARADGIDVVAVVTPNHLHYPVAKAFLEAGIHVICDKPLALTVEQAELLARAVAKSGKAFVLTQNNTGYPMVRQARSMVASGMLGKIRVIRVSYAQDWLTTSLEKSGQKQAAWRMNPALAGAGGAVADIGVHAFNLAQYISGLTLDAVCAHLDSFGDDRELDDNASVLLRYVGGASGVLWASQVAPGNNNALSIGVYGDKGGIEWAGEANDYLRYTPIGEPPRLITRGGPGANEIAAQATRMPAGHPEGYIEGFANLYADAADLILSGSTDAAAFGLPDINAGIDGMRFIDACVRSSRSGGIWTSVNGGEA